MVLDYFKIIYHSFPTYFYSICMFHHTGHSVVWVKCFWITVLKTTVESVLSKNLPLLLVNCRLRKKKRNINSVLIRLISISEFGPTKSILTLRLRARMKNNVLEGSLRVQSGSTFRVHWDVMHSLFHGSSCCSAVFYVKQN